MDPVTPSPAAACLPPRRTFLRRLAALALLGGGVAACAPARADAAPASGAAPGLLPLFDAHIHYSHDAAAQLPPREAVAMLRAAGLRGALVSSSDDAGTQRLLAEAPDLIVPSLRPYRSRADTATWTQEPAVGDYVEDLLTRYRYAALGEFHLYGSEGERPVPRRVLALARRHGLLLHAHADRAAVEGLFGSWPEARVLWAHSGFESPAQLAEMLQRHPRLWCDLAFRGDQARDGRVDPAWRELFLAYPDRFMVGTDTFTPERWHAIADHARHSRDWLADLPAPVAGAIGAGNAEALLRSLRGGTSRAAGA